MIENLSESAKLKLAIAFIHLYDGQFLCPYCRAPNPKTAIYCKTCDKDLSYMPIHDRLRKSEQIKYDNILSEVRGEH